MQDFESKRKNLFECLDAVAEQSIKGTILDQSESEKNVLETKKHFKKSKDEDIGLAKLRGKESLFKKPELPIAKCLKPRTSPDYKVNPHKWTKYSLDDADISDRMNTTAAFAFLKDMENKKNQEKDSSDEECSNDSDNIISKVIFNKSAGIKRSIRDVMSEDTSVTEEKPLLIGSKVVMPEYVVGKKTEKDKKIRVVKNTDKTSTKNELKLSHLIHNDEEEDNADEF